MKKRNILKKKKKSSQPEIKPPNAVWEAVKYSLIFVAIQAVILSLFFVMLHDTRQKNSEETTIVTGSVEKVVIWDPPKTAPQIYVTVNGEEFYLYWINSAESYKTALVGLKEEQNIYLTVQKTKDIGYWKKQREIVDIRSDSKVYYDISYHNSHMRFSRIGTCIFISVMWLFFTFWSGIMAFAMVQDCIAKAKRKAKKKRKGPKGVLDSSKSRGDA